MTGDIKQVGASQGAGVDERAAAEALLQGASRHSAPPHKAGGRASAFSSTASRCARPPRRSSLLPTRALAEAVAAEWEAQTERIDPATMPLTRLANSAIDGVMGREAEVRADIVKYAGSDLVCYRAEGPPELVRRQSETWDPVLVWAREALGASFHVARASCRSSSPRRRLADVARAIEAHGAFDLAALHVMTTLMGSALLALAHARGRLTAEEAWAAAHVDEDWQISQWGEDAEAQARRERRWAGDAGREPPDRSCSR